MPSLDVATIKSIFTSFAGTLLAIFSAGFIWLLKSAYRKHMTEVLTLAKFEQLFAVNLRLLSDNFEFIDSWIESLKKDRPFSVHFQDYLSNEEEIFNLNNLLLTNKILSLNYKLKRTSIDLSNVYKSYWDVVSEIDSIQDEQRKMASLRVYHATVQQTLQKIKENQKPLQNDLVDAMATIRVAANVRRHSLFGYLSIFFRDIVPTVNQQAIEAETKKLTEEIQKIDS